MACSFPLPLAFPTARARIRLVLPGVPRDLFGNELGASGSPSRDVSFQIGNFNALLRSGNRVFNDIGGDSPGGFDWGLPFFFGRNVFVGIEGGHPVGNRPLLGPIDHFLNHRVRRDHRG